jgi:hypothetical protein
MATIIGLRDRKRRETKPPQPKKVVVITPAQDKLFYLVLGFFLGANWLATMAALVRWITIPGGGSQ